MTTEPKTMREEFKAEIDKIVDEHFEAVTLAAQMDPTRLRTLLRLMAGTGYEAGMRKVADLNAQAFRSIEDKLND